MIHFVTLYIYKYLHACMNFGPIFGGTLNLVMIKCLFIWWIRQRKNYLIKVSSSVRNWLYQNISFLIVSEYLICSYPFFFFLIFLLLLKKIRFLKYFYAAAYHNTEMWVSRVFLATVTVSVRPFPAEKCVPSVKLSLKKNSEDMVKLTRTIYFENDALV